jgi:hypothetical protein
LRELRGAYLYAVDPRTEQRYPTATIPYRPDAICFEWVVFVAPEDRELAVREVLELPAAPASWGGAAAAGIRVEGDGRRAVSDFTDALGDGQIERRWCVAEGDPLGRYRIRVTSGTRELAEIAFEMVAEDR